ncbi:hypothetical protein F511_39434 [Dorcoceras hygrometricum]|uniref:Uncharacterized protein n=1 Tax=Dorcoceras hygrometricum TaxID=472368 RepID=A0A2Z7A9P1_9LAMI|nr:hypothetical protein F511_39434 [Dorcoceras hygrometricum]
MFPSSNSTDNPMESLFRKAIFCDQNPISKQYDPPIFSNFPSPFFEEHEFPLNQMLSHSPQMGGSSFLVSDNIPDPAGKDTARFNVVDASRTKEKSRDTNPSPVSTPVRRRSLGVVPRNRAGKKDRHSKICTAQGVRDRRMRLSLQVARKFFDLQDLLGYDKASKTIEWLFNKSKKAIKELARDHLNEGKNNISVSDAKSESLISECEVLSGIEENSNTEIKERKVTATSRNNADISPSSVNKGSGRKSQKTTKSSQRESRDEARARARCRTIEKMMMRRLGNLSQWNKSNPNYEDIQKVGSSNIPFEEPNSDFQERVSSYHGDYHNLPDLGTIENLFGSSSTTSNSCPNPDLQCPATASACFQSRISSILGFLGNWDVLNNEKNQVPLVGNPNSVFVDSPNFLFQ